MGILSIKVEKYMFDYKLCELLRDKQHLMLKLQRPFKTCTQRPLAAMRKSCSCEKWVTQSLLGFTIEMDETFTPLFI